MAKLILEIQTRGLNIYHRLEQFPVTLGRALDNDIILSDSAISPHHLRLERDETDSGQLYLQKLATENGTVLNGRPLGNQRVTVSVPSYLVLGNRKISLLSSDMPVAATNLMKFGGFFSVLGHPAVAALLLAVVGVALFLDNVLQTFQAKDIWFYISDTLMNIAIVLFFALILSLVNWLVSHRWAFTSALGAVCLLLLSKVALTVTGNSLNYFFTADWPRTALLTFYNLPLVTVLLYLYQRSASYLRPLTALGVALLLSAPLLVLEMINWMDTLTVRGEFSSEPNYNQTLSSFNLHAAPPVTLDTYLQQAKEKLPSQTGE